MMKNIMFALAFVMVACSNPQTQTEVPADVSAIVAAWPVSPDTFEVYTMNQAFSEAVVSICDTLRRCTRARMPKVFPGDDSRTFGKIILLKAPSAGMDKFVFRVRYRDGRYSKFTVRHTSIDRKLLIYLHIHGFDNAPNWPAVSPGVDGFRETYPDGMKPGPCKSYTECDYSVDEDKP